MSKLIEQLKIHEGVRENVHAYLCCWVRRSLWASAETSQTVNGGLGLSEDDEIDYLLSQ